MKEKKRPTRKPNLIVFTTHPEAILATEAGDSGDLLDKIFKMTSPVSPASAAKQFLILLCC
jgi:hypothetical protein